MNEMTPVGGGQIAIRNSAPSDPAMSPGVRGAMGIAIEPVIGRRQWGDDDPGHRMVPPLLADAEWLEAQRASAAFDAMLRPVTLDVVSAWLLPINFGSRNPQSTQDFAMRAAAIAELCADLPAAAFTAEARRKLGTGFFPSAADVRAVIEPAANDWRRKRDALRSLRKAETAAPTERQELTADERTAMSAKAKALVAELRAGSEATKARAKVSAVPVAPMALIAIWEAAERDGLPGAGARLAVLRRQFAQQDHAE